MAKKRGPQKKPTHRVVTQYQLYVDLRAAHELVCRDLKEAREQLAAATKRAELVERHFEASQSQHEQSWSLLNSMFIARLEELLRKNVELTRELKLANDRGPG